MNYIIFLKKQPITTAAAVFFDSKNLSKVGYGEIFEILLEL